MSAISLVTLLGEGQRGMDAPQGDAWVVGNSLPPPTLQGHRVKSDTLKPADGNADKRNPLCRRDEELCLSCGRVVLPGLTVPLECLQSSADPCVPG